MESVLMIVTLVSLGLAIAMSLLAWKLLREERLRSLANAEALQAMAADGELDLRPPRSAPPERPAPAPASKSSGDDGHARKVVAVVSPENLAHASADLRSVRTPRPKPGTQVRFDEFAANESLSDWDFRPERELFVPAARLSTASTSSSHRPVSESMFGSIVEQPAPKRRWLALAAVALCMAAGVAGVYRIYRPAVEAVASSTETLVAGAGERRPLELLSLRHSADPDGTFTVTGLVQNPSSGLTARKVVAVVYLFDRDGNYFASGKAALDFLVLQPGDESPFVIRVPNVGRVGRYRVGFRFEDGSVAVHVDRRGQVPGGTTGDSISPTDSHRSVSPIADPRRSQGRP